MSVTLDAEMKKALPLSGQLRYYLNKELENGMACPSCGSRKSFHSLRQIARELELSPATLSRFANGKVVDSNTIDKLFPRYFL